MKEKMTPHIIAVTALVVFIVLGLACASAPSSESSEEVFEKLASGNSYGESEAVSNQTPADNNPPAGITVEGSSLVEKFDWLKNNAEKGQTYVVILDKDEDIPPQTFSGTDKTIILWGLGKPQTISLNNKGQLFTINGAGIKLVLDRNVVLQGRKDSTKQLVEIKRGTVEMKEGAVITGNTSGAVFINKKGKFIMNGGTITRNTSSSMQGVIQVAGTLEMTGGRITINNGHGVGLYSNAWTVATFNMSGGSINRNNGCGIYMYMQGKTTMNGGTIFGNTTYGVELM
jgi:hypothetical protein